MGDLVVLSLEPWDEVWRRNQYLVDQLRRRRPDLKVLFVEPPVDAWRSPSRASWRPTLAQPDGAGTGLWTMRPVKPLPRLAGPWSDVTVRRQVRRAARCVRLRSPSLWLNDLQHTGLIAATGWPTLYDVTDDWLVESTVPERVRRRRRRLEEEALRRSREVVVCSPGLGASRGRTRPVTLVPNGVDVELMTAAAPRPADLPPSPVAVYVGTVHEERFDVPLLTEVLEGVPGLQVAVVGPVASPLPDHPRLHVLGPRPHLAVPGYLQHADVVLVPHRVNDFTESLDPIKAYECLAVGTPTVATPVAGFRNLPAPVVVAARSSYAARVAEVVAEPPPRTPALPPDATWEGRSLVFERLLFGTETVATRPRVLFVDHVAQLSGGEIALVRLVEALGERVEAHVVLAEDGPLAPRLRTAGAQVHVLPMAHRLRALRKDAVKPGGGVSLRTATDLVRYTRTLRRFILDLDPDVVHTNSLKAALYGGVAGRLARRKVVWHVRDRVAEDYLPRSAVRLVHTMGRAIPHAIIANSSATLATMPTRRPAAVVYSAVVYDSLQAAPQVSPEGGDTFRIGVVGRLAPWKGQDVFIDAFALAFPDDDQVAAVLIGSAMFGEDDYEAGLRRRAETAGIGGRVDFRGFREDVWAELARLDVLVHCSVTPEPFGQVVVEGMAAGVPVVAADAGGPAEIITSGRDGMLVPPGDVEALAAALRTLRCDAGLRRRLVDGGRVRLARFSPERSASDLLAVYAQLAQ